MLTRHFLWKYFLLLNWIFWFSSFVEKLFFQRKLFRVKILFFWFLLKKSLPLTIIIVLFNELVQLFHAFLNQSMKMIFNSIITSANGESLKEDLNHFGPFWTVNFVNVNHGIVLLISPFFLTAFQNWAQLIVPSVIWQT